MFDISARCDRARNLSYTQYCATQQCELTSRSARLASTYTLLHSILASMHKWNIICMGYFGNPCPSLDKICKITGCLFFNHNDKYDALLSALYTVERRSSGRDNMFSPVRERYWQLLYTCTHSLLVSVYVCVCVCNNVSVLCLIKGAA